MNPAVFRTFWVLADNVLRQVVPAAPYPRRVVIRAANLFLSLAISSPGAADEIVPALANPPTIVLAAGQAMFARAQVLTALTLIIGAT